MKGQFSITHQHLLHYKHELLHIDVLGGVDQTHLERLVCTLRLSYADYAPQRSTLDLYAHTQVETLLHRLCELWSVSLIELSASLQALIVELESYRLEHFKQTYKPLKQVALSSSERKKAHRLLKRKDLLNYILKRFHRLGLLGQDEPYMLLFFALASHRHLKPLSVLYYHKEQALGKQALSVLASCLPEGSYSYHHHISANALYYFKPADVDGKALVIEDMDWTQAMLSPLATLQAQGRLVKTRAIKDKTGLLQSSRFELKAKLCLVACLSAPKPQSNKKQTTLPFICIQAQASPEQEQLRMDYERQSAAGLRSEAELKEARQELQALVTCLKPQKVINPFAPLIVLPNELEQASGSLRLLLHTIEVISFMFQFQREQLVDEATGETYIQTHPDDIALAFRYLKPHLFQEQDELSPRTRGFYLFLQDFLQKAKTNEFTAFDIRKAEGLHPRTLNRYLQELKLFSYIKVVGGNKHRGGYRYALRTLSEHQSSASSIDQQLEACLQTIYTAHSRTLSQKGLSEPKTQQNKGL